MSTKQNQKDKMASWRKDLPYLPESLREEESDGNRSCSDISQAFSKRYSPASSDSYSPDNDKETDSSESDTGVSEQSEVCSSRKKKRKGRRSVWEERHINDLVDVICSSEYYKKKLIFTNTKNSKNAEIYGNVLKELGQRYEDGSFPFSVYQLRNKFKKCISECKKIALTVKTATGVKRVQDEKQLGAWFNQLFPLVQTRDSCNPDMSVESSSSLQLSDGEAVKRASDNRTPTDEQSSDGIDQGDDSDKKQFVPIKKGTRKKVKSQNSSSALSTAVELFEKVVNNDPTTQLMSFFKEENQRAREHELKLLELFMSQRQPAVSYSAGPSSMISPERSPSPFAAPSYCVGSSSMISPERSPSPYAYTAQGLLYEEPRQCQFSESEGKRYHQL